MMEIRRWHYYVVINCVVLLPYLVAKPFSINEAIAAEERKRQEIETIAESKTTETIAERFSLNKALRTEPTKHKKFKVTESLKSRRRKISPLKYRKRYQIKSPLKPKKINYFQKPRHKRRNLSKKREISGNGKINQKYIPLLRNLGMLFDNLLGSDYIDSNEIKRIKSKSSRKSKDTNRATCTCANKLDSEVAESKSSQEAITTTTAVTEVSTSAETVFTEAPTTTTYNSSLGNISSIGQNKNLSVLFTRDTDSTWRNHSGLSQGSSPPFHRSTERYIARDLGDDKYNTPSREIYSHSTSHKEHSHSNTRNDASSDEHRGRVRGNGSDTQSPVYRRETYENQSSKVENDHGHSRGDISEYKGENNFKIGGDETKGPEILPEFIRESRGYVPKDNVSLKAEFIQPQEDNKKGDDSIARHNASNKRFPVGSSAFTTKDKKASSTNQSVITSHDLSNTIKILENSPQHKAPYVTIIDGYSIARDKNGKNKLAEQSIRIHS